MHSDIFSTLYEWLCNTLLSIFTFVLTVGKKKLSLTFYLFMYFETYSVCESLPVTKSLFSSLSSFLFSSLISSLWHCDLKHHFS